MSTERQADLNSFQDIGEALQQDPTSIPAELGVNQRGEGDVMLSVREAALRLNLSGETLREQAKRASDSGAEWPQLVSGRWYASANAWSSLFPPSELLVLQEHHERSKNTVASGPRGADSAQRITAPANGRCPHCGTRLRKSRWVHGEGQGTELSCLCGYSWS